MKHCVVAAVCLSAMCVDLAAVNQNRVLDDLVIAAFNLDLRGVDKLTNKESVNSRFGRLDRLQFSKVYKGGEGGYSPVGHENWTPLMALCYAPRDGNGLEIELRIASVLLSKGANMELGNSHGASPLIVAAMLGKEELALLLLAAGARVNGCVNGGLVDGKTGGTALHYAVGMPNLLSCLIRRGSDLNALNSEGMTAMHLAVLTGNTRAEQMLTDAGAQTEVRDIRGYTAHQYRLPDGPGVKAFLSEE